MKKFTQLLAKANKAQKMANSIWFDVQKEAIRLAVQERDLRAMSRMVKCVHAHQSLTSSALVQFFLHCAGAADGGPDCAITYDVKNMTFSIKTVLDENGLPTGDKRDLPTSMMGRGCEMLWSKWAPAAKPNPFKMQTIFAALKKGLKDADLPETQLTPEDRSLLAELCSTVARAGFAEKLQ